MDYLSILAVRIVLASFQVSFAYHAGSFRRGGRIHGTRSDGTLMGIFLFQGIFVCLDLVKKMPLSGSLLWRHTDFGCVSQAHIVVRIVLVSFQVSFTCE